MLKRNKQGIVKTILVIDKAEYVSLNIKKKNRCQFIGN